MHSDRVTTPQRKLLGPGMSSMDFLIAEVMYFVLDTKTTFSQGDAAKM